VTKGQRSQPQVLVIDDDPAMRTTLEALVHDLGYAADQAANGAEALAAVHDGHHYAAVIMDLDMPVLSGEEFLSSLREQLGPDSVVVVSGAEPPRVRRVRHHPAVAVVVGKPFGIDDLSAALSCVQVGGGG
jgi:CheY-like chemotaxis protein